MHDPDELGAVIDCPISDANSGLISYAIARNNSIPERDDQYCGLDKLTFQPQQVRPVTENLKQLPNRRPSQR